MKKAIIFFGLFFTISIQVFGQKTQIADQYFEKAQSAFAYSDYAKAIEFYLKAYEAEKKCPVPRTKKMAQYLFSAGFCNTQIQQYYQGITLYEQALEIYQKTDNVYDILLLLNNLGITYQKYGNYSKALEIYMQALKLAKKSNIKFEIAEQNYNIGIIYQTWHEYEKALLHYEKALEINKAQNDSSAMANTLNNIGYVYSLWGKYDEALKYYLQASDIDMKLNDALNITIDMNNIGSLCEAWGNYELALSYYQKALELSLEFGYEKRLSIQYNNLAGIYSSLNQHDKAIEYYQKSLEMSRKNKYKLSEIHCLNNIGTAYFNLKDYENAISSFLASLKMSKENNLDIEQANVLNNIGMVYYRASKLEQATYAYQKALEIFEQKGKKNSTATVLNNMGAVYYSCAKFHEAIPYFENAVKLIEEIRITASDEMRRDYLDKHLRTYRFLISCYIKTGQNHKAFQTTEQSSARYLAEQLSNVQDKVPFVNLKIYQKTLSPETAIIKFANMDWDYSARLVLDENNIFSTEIKNSNVIDTIFSIYKNNICPTVKKEKIRFRGHYLQDTLYAKNQPDFILIINYYRHLLTKANKNPKQQEMLTFLSKQLYLFLFNKIEPYIKNKTELIILPDGILGFVPFETLIMPDGRYLCQKYQISYLQSIAVSNLIAQRPTAKNSILTIGGAIYNDKTYQSDMEITEKELNALKKQFISAQKKNKNMGKIYDKLQRGGWTNLPGTKVEATAISMLEENSTLITGQEANETRIKKMSKSEELKKYRILHFATHGIAVPEMPELSAIVLSLDADSLNDGYLRMREISELDVQAEFVNLSACQTGLGKIYGGEGVVGLTQAWLIAGSKGLSVSLWQVDDIATKEFMIAMYKKVFEKNMSFNQAIYQTKIEFINGKFGNQYKQPYYWAPFVYYGN